MTDQRVKKILDALNQEIEEERARNIFTGEEVSRYLKDPVAFCKEEIGFSHSTDKEKFLQLMADLNIRDVLISGGRGTGKCISSETMLVQSDGGYRSASEIWENISHNSSVTLSGDRECVDTPNLGLIAYDEKNNCFVKERVKHAYRRLYKGKIVKIRLKNGTCIRVTPEHMMLTSIGWTEARNIFPIKNNQKHGADGRFTYETIPGMRLRLGSHVDTYSTVTSVTTQDYNGWVYDFEMETHHNFIGGIGGTVIYHNSWTAAALALWSAMLLPPLYEDNYLISVLAGSNFQAVKVFEHMSKFILKSNRIGGMITRKTQNEMEFSNGAVVLIYKTSEKYARSRHPDLLILDEVTLADQEEGGKVVAAALDSVSAARHGRRVMLSTPSYMRGLFGEYWYKAEELGFARFRWTAEPGKRTWMDSTREGTEWERAKRTSQNFDTEWLAIPHSDVRYLHAEEDVDKAACLIESGVVSSLHEKGYSFVIGADFGYDPAPTVLTAAAVNEEEGVVYILEQESIERGSVEFVVGRALDMGSRYGAQELYGDLFGKIYMDSMNDVGIQTHEVSFSKLKELMITKLNSCLRQGFVKIDVSCKDGIREMKNMHRDSRGKVVKGGDDHYDSILCCFVPLLESGKITFGWLDGI